MVPKPTTILISPFGLRHNSIDPESCIADFIRACWSAWLGGRGATLTELHVLVARRERARGSARFSAGIAGLLLVVGIVGTLSSIHPVLKAFQFKVTSDGELEGVVASTELVNSLVNDLGDAFWPSLVALVGTVLVVLFRGLYSLSLHQYVLALDRFAIGTLIPRYRPNSLADEYGEVNSALTQLAERIQSREQNFEGVVKRAAKTRRRDHPCHRSPQEHGRADGQGGEKPLRSIRVNRRRHHKKPGCKIAHISGDYRLRGNFREGQQIHRRSQNRDLEGR